MISVILLIHYLTKWMTRMKSTESHSSSQSAILIDQIGFWASAEQRGEFKWFHPIRFHNSWFSAVPLNVLGDGKVSVYAAVKVDVEHCTGVLWPVNFKIDQKSKDKLLRRMDAYCSSHLDRFMAVVSIRDWRQSVTPVELVLWQRIICNSKQEKCAWQTLENRLRAAAGSDVAMEFLMTKNRMVRSLGQAGLWLESTARESCSRNCQVRVELEANFML